MAVSKKGSRKIVVNEHEFRWSATGNDGWISVVIWPSENDDCRIVGSIDYHHEWVELNEGHFASEGQLIVTNRIIRQVIIHYGVEYLLEAKGQINLKAIEDIYDVTKALRS